MNLLGQGEHDLFILALLLIAAVYFVGLSTEGSVLFGGINSLGNTYTGRNQAGVFANYPSGG